MAERPPNILLLFTDQEAFYRHGPARPCYDRLGREGVRFDRAYSVCLLCTPARCSLMTGLYPHAHGYVTLESERGHDAESVAIRLFGRLAQGG